MSWFLAFLSLCFIIVGILILIYALVAAGLVAGTYLCAGFLCFVVAGVLIMIGQLEAILEKK